MKVAQKQVNNDSNRSATNANHSSWENQLAQIADNSNKAVAQRAAIDGINDSPRMLAQRQQIEGYLELGQPQKTVSPHSASQNNQHTIQRARKWEGDDQLHRQCNGATEVAIPNRIGLPDNLKSGIESLSGLSMEHVKVHYNSLQPEQIDANAYAQGSDIHIAPGQERQLPHEVWHVVQQAQGRVRPTIRLQDGVNINDDDRLEHEAEIMGAKALASAPPQNDKLEATLGIAPYNSGSVDACCRQRMLKNPSENKKRERKEEENADQTKKLKTKNTTLDEESSGETMDEDQAPVSEDDKGNKESDSAQAEESTEEAEKPEAMEVEPVAEAKESSETSEYWARVVVRAKEHKQQYGPEDLFVTNVSISPERRATKLVTRQGDHLVAWSVMYRYWNAKLQGPLANVLSNLKTFVLEDQTADESDSPNPAKNRALALYFINQLLNPTKEKPLALNDVLNYLEKAISLFVEANQASSFAVHGKASGGQDEGSSRIELEVINELAVSTDKLEEFNQKQGNITKLALNLIDVKDKKLSEKTLSKVCYTWLTMLDTLYPNLKKYFINEEDKTAGATKFGEKSAIEWANIWKDYYFKNQSNSENALVPENAIKEYEKAGKSWSTLVEEKEKEPSTGALVIAKPVSDKEQEHDLLKAEEVNITYLELPETLRAKTRFGATQGSHTIAWTFKRASLLARLKDKTAAQILKLISDLSERDAKNLDQNLDESLIEDAGKLKADTEALKPKQMPLHDWITHINDSVITYIQINQLLPTTTYKGAGQAYGHGEGTANKAFKENKKSFEDLVINAAKYVDMGIFYKPLVKKAEEYASSLKSYVGKNPIKKLLLKLLEQDNNAKLTQEEETIKSPKNIKDELRPGIETKRDELREVTPVKSNAATVTSFADKYPNGEGANAWNIFGHIFFHKKVNIVTAEVTRIVALAKADLKTFDQIDSITGELLTWINKPQKPQKEEEIKNDLFRKEIYEFLTQAHLNNEAYDRIVKIRDNISKARGMNIEVKKEDLTRLAERFDELYSPAIAIEDLYNDNHTILEIIMADFYDDLQHVYPNFYTDLSNNVTQQQNLLVYILEAPLKQDDVVIGNPLFSHLQLDQNAYILYMAQMKEYIEGKKNTWAESISKKHLGSPS